MLVFLLSGTCNVNYGVIKLTDLTTLQNSSSRIKPPHFLHYCRLTVPRYFFPSVVILQILAFLHYNLCMCIISCIFSELLSFKKITACLVKLFFKMHTNKQGTKEKIMNLLISYKQNLILVQYF